VEVQQQFGDDVTIIGVPGLTSDRDSVRGFVESTGTQSITHVLDLDGDLWDRFGVSQQRTYVFVNDDGTRRTGGYGQLFDDVDDLTTK